MQVGVGETAGGELCCIARPTFPVLTARSKDFLKNEVGWVASGYWVVAVRKMSRRAVRTRQTFLPCGSVGRVVTNNFAILDYV